MKTSEHQYEDKLLEFAYGDLSDDEAHVVNSHVHGCVKCAASLAQIRSVRSMMSALPKEAAPEAGLDSLLAYAEQTAKRNAQAQHKPAWWWKSVLMLSSAMALLLIGVVAFRAQKTFLPDPATAAAQTKEEKQLANFSPVATVAAPEPPSPVLQESRRAARLQEKVADFERVADFSNAARLGEGVSSPRPSARAPKPAAAPPSEAELAKGDVHFDSAFGLAAEQAVGSKIESPAVNAPGKAKVATGGVGAIGSGSAAGYDGVAGLVDSLEVDKKPTARKTEVSARPTIEHALAVLKSGAKGEARADALKQLCDEYEALGEIRMADAYCDQLLREFPRSASAQMVTLRRGAVQGATPRAKTAPIPGAASEAESR